MVVEYDSIPARYLHKQFVPYERIGLLQGRVMQRKWRAKS
jgi:hypothetical protein